MFLNCEELEIYTGYKRPRDQIKTLIRRGVPFDVVVGGRPIVLRSTIEKRLGGVTQPESRNKPRLNLTAMD